MALIEVLVLHSSASPSSVAITFELLDTANQLRRAAGRPAFNSNGRIPARRRRDFLGCTEGLEAEGPPQVLVALVALARSMVMCRSSRARTPTRLGGTSLRLWPGAEVASSSAGVFLRPRPASWTADAPHLWWLAPLFAPALSGCRSTPAP